MANYTQYKIGFSQRILMVDVGLLCKFDCQPVQESLILECVRLTFAYNTWGLKTLYILFFQNNCKGITKEMTLSHFKWFSKQDQKVVAKLLRIANYAYEEYIYAYTNACFRARVFEGILRRTPLLCNKSLTYKRQIR